MLSEKQLSQLKHELLSMKDNLERSEKQTDLEESQRDATGELSMYDNHPADAGTELFEREKDMALQVHAGSELEKVKDALKRMEEGNFGTCEKCGQEIGFERLEALPYTTRCIEHTQEQGIPDDRPAEEDVLAPPRANTFKDRWTGNERDDEDSFQEIAQFGTSETPSDFSGDHKDYNRLYEGDIKDGATEEFEEFVATDMTGKERGFVRSFESDKYEEQLDEERIESPLGNIPFKRTDSYVDENEKSTEDQ